MNKEFSELEKLKIAKEKLLNENLENESKKEPKQPITYSETRHTKNSRQFEHELRKTNIFFRKLENNMEPIENEEDNMATTEDTRFAIALGQYKRKQITKQQLFKIAETVHRDQTPQTEVMGSKDDSVGGVRRLEYLAIVLPNDFAIELYDKMKPSQN